MGYGEKVKTSDLFDTNNNGSALHDTRLQEFELRTNSRASVTALDKAFNDRARSM
jgi:hypothetical protein